MRQWVQKRMLDIVQMLDLIINVTVILIVIITVMIIIVTVMIFIVTMLTESMQRLPGATVGAEEDAGHRSDAGCCAHHQCPETAAQAAD